MSADVERLADAVDEQVGIHGRLLDLAARQRQALISASPAALEQVRGEMEREVGRLAAAERRRVAAMADLADRLGTPSTRWPQIAARLDDEDHARLAPRIDALSAAVRAMETANAVNGRLVVDEMRVLDATVRSAGAERVGVGRVYTARGAEARAGGRPLILNTSA